MNLSSRLAGWYAGFNVRLEQCTGFWLSVWDLSQRIVRRPAITIFIRHGGDDSIALVPSEAQFEWKLGKHFNHDGFYVHQVPLACMAVF